MYSNTPHVNYGFQHEEEQPPPYQPPPYNPNYSQGLYPTTPQYPTTPRVPINTHHTVTAGRPHPPPARKVAGKNRLVAVFGIILILVVVIIMAVLIWYFAFQMCPMGQRCGENGACISSTQWCNGRRDCPGGEDESHCFRIYGSNFQLQGFSAKDKTWKPVCSSRWDDNIGKTACQQIGFSRTDYVSSGQMYAGSSASGGYMVLNTDFGIGPGESVHSYLTDSFTCPSKAVVTLKCVDCGKSTAQTRIVGGDVVNSGTRWPWQVSLQSGGGHLCGGSIISSSWIVSAAHCFQSRPNPGQWTVFAGFLRLNDMRFSSGNSVSHIISHPDYNPRTNDNDIAMMKLSSPLRLSSSVGPVCLPSAGLDFSRSRECYITGFGALFSQGPVSNELREARVTLIDRSLCNNRQIYNGQITESMICAGKLQGGVDSCQGDSGGPLVTQENSVWWLVGDTSWGQGCAVRNKPGVYGNVTFFLEWIYEQMQKH